MKQIVSKKTTLSLVGDNRSMTPSRKQSIYAESFASAAGATVSHSSSDDGLDDEDHETAKVIQKLTGSNLDIKALEIVDLSEMRQF